MSVAISLSLSLFFFFLLTNALGSYHCHITMSSSPVNRSTYLTSPAVIGSKYFVRPSPALARSLHRFRSIVSHFSAASFLTASARSCSSWLTTQLHIVFDTLRTGILRRMLAASRPGYTIKSTPDPSGPAFSTRTARDTSNREAWTPQVLTTRPRSFSCHKRDFESFRIPVAVHCWGWTNPYSRRWIYPPKAHPSSMTSLYHGREDTDLH
ncbi:hypothetical protein PAXRUDRAFT_755010 [Paxillus rubicundulus Ve08.2h10]|uniref:Secreted protein n=1 Tax=Paxillus rubicundulus Ve08.2h10 TaxID=930991 RepID=A0A0D0DHQ3_9AGAM|nr:hypothetical protein PAXRUDRAFT_755010 [Paxillus rubicundulus Ve08.2h10]